MPSTRSAPSSPDVSPQSSPRPPRANNDRLTLLTRLVRKGEKKGLFVEKMPASIYQVKCGQILEGCRLRLGAVPIDPCVHNNILCRALTSAHPGVEQRLWVSEDQRSNLNEKTNFRCSIQQDASPLSLTISWTKSKIQCLLDFLPQLPQNVNIGLEKVEAVKDFNYLGSKICTSEPDISHRLQLTLILSCIFFSFFFVQGTDCLSFFLSFFLIFNWTVKFCKCLINLLSLPEIWM